MEDGRQAIYLRRGGGVVVVEEQLVLLDLLGGDAGDAVDFGEAALDVVDERQEPEYFAEPHVVLDEGQRHARRFHLCATTNQLFKALVPSFRRQRRRCCCCCCCCCCC